MKKNASVFDKSAEVAAEDPIGYGSNGGFSDIFSLPKYQVAAMKDYYASFSPSVSQLSSVKTPWLISVTVRVRALQQ